MAPLVTTDFVGLDVHKAIVDNIYINTKDAYRETFIMPDFVESLISNNLLGRKVGSGLYKLVKDDSGKKTMYVYDIDTKAYRPKNNYVFEFIEKMVQLLSKSKYDEAFLILIKDNSDEADICKHFLINYILYGLEIALELGDNITDVDDVMATGFSWIPPLALVEAFGGVEVVKEIAAKQNKNYSILESVVKSKYDYRSFLKARK